MCLPIPSCIGVGVGTKGRPSWFGRRKGEGTKGKGEKRGEAGGKPVIDAVGWKGVNKGEGRRPGTGTGTVGVEVIKFGVDGKEFGIFGVFLIFGSRIRAKETSSACG